MIYFLGTRQLSCRGHDLLAGPNRAMRLAHAQVHRQVLQAWQWRLKEFLDRSHIREAERMGPVRT